MNLEECPMKENDKEYYLTIYREIWNNRRLESQSDPETVLYDAIRRDLLDENSHPRARRTNTEKYYLATKRILESSLSSEDKIDLIRLHQNQLEIIRSEKN